MYTVDPKHMHTHTIIFLHGRDSIASEFASELFESQASNDLTLPEIFPTIKWVFPSSKLRHSARFGSELSQWFDMWSVENPLEKAEIQKEGLVDSVSMILDIIRQESRLITLDKVILAGISQGCAAAIIALIYAGVKIGAFVGFCSWLPLHDEFEKSTGTELDQLNITTKVHHSLSFPDNSRIKDLTTDINQSQLSFIATPVFLSHSVDDDVVPIRNGKILCKTLRNIGLTVTWKEYMDGGHWFNEPKGIDDLVIFLKDIMAVE